MLYPTLLSMMTFKEQLENLQRQELSVEETELTTQGSSSLKTPMTAQIT
jgi:hypothetical protein